MAFWVLYANLLIKAKQWDALSQLALTIRLNGKLVERLRASLLATDGSSLNYGQAVTGKNISIP